MTSYVAPVPIELPAGSRLTRARRRARTVATFGSHLVPVVVRRVVGRPPASDQVARRLRRSFEALGSTYVKFGQLVGSSPGAFGPAVADEFRSCLDTGPAVAFGQVRAAVERAAGRPLAEVYRSFDETPAASASIAVVHRATTTDGREVAVKVLRPGIEALVATDLDIMAPLFKRLALRGIPIAGPLYRFLSGFRGQVAEELDLTNEARTMAHFRQLFMAADLDAIVVPEPLPELSDRQVLVMEFLDGVAIDDLEAIEILGHDPKPLVQELLRSWFLTGLRDGMFHGDIHAGNLMLLRDGRIGMIDWGIVGRLDEPTHRLFRRFVEGVLGDASAWVEISEFMERLLPVPAELREGRGPPVDGAEIKEILTRPFGEVDLTDAFKGPRVGENLSKRERRRAIKRFRKVVIGGGVADSGFGHANFMLFKQLLYFERYGKLYLADTALMGDRDYLETVLAESPR